MVEMISYDLIVKHALFSLQTPHPYPYLDITEVSIKEIHTVVMKSSAQIKY